MKAPESRRARQRENERRWRVKHPERVKEVKRSYRQRNRVGLAAGDRDWYSRRGWHVLASVRRKKKLAALALLGGVCESCGETDDMKLTFDHINGDGRDGRKENGESGEYLHTRLLNGTVEASRFRVLCYNCNLPLAKFGFLPIEAMRLLYER